MFITCWLIAFCNSFWSIMKVHVFHGSSRIFTFTLMKKHVFNKSKYKYKIIPFWRFYKKLHILCLCFVAFVVLIWCYLGECSFPISFTYDFFFGVEFVNVKVGWMLVESNVVSNWWKLQKISHEHYIKSSKL
jgi:hypothetical protein